MFLWYICFFAVFLPSALGQYVVLSGDDKVVIGGTAQIRAELFDDQGNPATGTFRYTWDDNAVPQHTWEERSTSHVSLWNVTYPASVYGPGPYNVQVTVDKNYFVWVRYVSQRTEVTVTPYLNGDMGLTQANRTRRKFVSNADPVTHELFISDPDRDYLNHTKRSVVSYWFVDGFYYGAHNGLGFAFNYSEPEVPHFVEALVIASPAAVAPPNATAAPPNGTDSNDVAPSLPTALDQWLASFAKGNGTLGRGAGFALNTSLIPLNPNNTYGYFRTNFTVQAPIKASPMNGTNWLMDGSILNITVSCNGSYPYTYCVLLKSGLYNVTGNETCSEDRVVRNCSIAIQHFFTSPAEYTFVVIITNTVSKVVKPIAVNVYKVTKHPQLSVIIVPVSFGVVAIALVIFGFAYYVQSRRTYTIEVANFDFGNQTNGMEYKTFRERLRESISHSFTNSQDMGDSDTWSPGRKYGSMQ